MNFSIKYFWRGNILAIGISVELDGILSNPSFIV